METTKKTLVLIDNLYKMYGLSGKIQQNILFLPLMKCSDKKRIIYRGLRKIHLSIPITGKELWFSYWTNIVEDFDTIIMGETGNTYNVAKYIKKKFPQKRIIIWFRNSIVKTVNPSNYDRNICEIWSFDKVDCDTYGFSYNPQFYTFNSLYKPQKIEYDAFFIGNNKGRLKQILEIQSILENQGLIVKFCIVGYNSNSMSYDKILDYISKSKAIVDIQGEWQSGITLRPLESIFYKKKLISNCVNLINADFYDSENIFLFGKDNETRLKDFIETEYKIINEEIVESYNIKSWVNRFYK